MSDIRKKLQEIKDLIVPRKLEFIKIPISEAEKAQYGNFQAYMPLKHAKKFGLDDCRRVDTFDFGAGSIKFYQREKPRFDGIILDSAHDTVSDAEKAMEYLAKKYELPVSAYLNSRFSFKNPNQQILQTKEIDRL